MCLRQYHLPGFVQSCTPARLLKTGYWSIPENTLMGTMSQANCVHDYHLPESSSWLSGRMGLLLWLDLYVLGKSLTSIFTVCVTFISTDDGQPILVCYILQKLLIANGCITVALELGRPKLCSVCCHNFDLEVHMVGCHSV